MTQWPEPTPIRNALPPVQSFDERLLPDSLRPFVVDIAERMQVSLDGPAIIVTVSLAGAVNRRARIQPKARDTGWKVVPNLWGGIVLPPGGLKSPMLAAGTQPLQMVQESWHRQHVKDMAEYCAINEKLKSGSSRKPIAGRLVVNDATFEKLHELMSQNPGGLLVIRDELTGWIAELDRSGREGERGFYLSAWNGDTPHTLDRIKRGTVHVAACCVSMIGGIQPERLKQYLANSGSVRLQDDGLIQRFQLLVWPDFSPYCGYVDRKPDESAVTVVEEIFQKLVQLDPANPVLFGFDPVAQGWFEDWFEWLELRLRSGCDSEILTSHLSKYRSLMPSLALLFELADRVAARGFVGFGGFLGMGPPKMQRVGMSNAKRAIEWCDYLESHANRVYSCVGTGAQNVALFLLKKIRSNAVWKGTPITVREIVSKNWGLLKTNDQAIQAFSTLERNGWVRDATKKPGELGGRPSPRYEVNPRVWDDDVVFE